MSCGVGTPVNQVRLTNVAYVRLQKRGKRFEIACYRNKVLNWRNKIETDLGEVLQIDTVFTNVSKGMLASQKDLLEYFNTSDQKLVCQEILERGELQVSEQERQALTDSTFRDVATIVADKAVNPEGRSYTISMIQNAMKQIHYSVSLTKSAKQQALDVIKRLRTVMPIQRACMLLRVIYPILAKAAVVNWLSAQRTLVSIEAQGALTSSTSEDSDEILYTDIKSDPEVFKRLEEMVRQETKGVGRVDVLQLRIASGSATGVYCKDDENEEDEVEEEPVATQKIPQIKEQKGKTSCKGLQNLIQATSCLLSIDEESEKRHNVEDADSTLATGMAVRKKQSKQKDKKLHVFQQISLSDDSNSSDSDSSATAVGSSLRSDNTNLSILVEVAMLLPDGHPKGYKPSGLASNKTNVGGGEKKGKKTKRLEKDLEAERKGKAADLKLRLLHEQEMIQSIRASTASTTLNTAIISDTTSTGAHAGGGQTCNTCGGCFQDVTEYRAHFRSEWHRHNLKMKMKGLPVIPSETLFIQLAPTEIVLDNPGF